MALDKVSTSAIYVSPSVKQRYVHAYLTEELEEPKHTSAIIIIHFCPQLRALVVMYKCESWTTKKAEHQRIDAFELWRKRRLLRVPWTARRLKQSILKGINPEYSLEGLMLKL